MTARTALWRVLQTSVRGTAHVRDELPCQDSGFAVVTRPAEEDFLVVACADGAGSAELSQEGSRIACTDLVQLVCAELQAGLRVEQIDRTLVTKWYATIHANLGAAAEERQVPRRQLACTLLMAIAGESTAVFAQVGDGAIVVRDGERYDVIFWPQSGEYLNLTNFVTDETFSTALQISTLGRVEEIAVMTDGLQMLALNFAMRTPHHQFFEPMFEPLRRTLTPDDLVVPLRGFLGSPQVVDKTDDDLTLILATRWASAPATS